MRRVALVVLAIVAVLVLVGEAQASSGPWPQCAFYPISGFGKLWFTGQRVAHQVGCPTSQEYNVGVQQQRFQNGAAVWFSDSNTVFVLTNDGRVYPFTGCDSIGALYDASPWVRWTLGWPSEPARSVTAAWQDFQNGAMFWTNQLGRIVFFDGWYERF
ncbi:MAG: hypothetical protein U0768_03885 [Anaerolineae bacterium]